MQPNKFDLSKVRLFYLYALFALSYVLINYFTNQYLLTDEFYVLMWSDQFARDRVNQMLEMSNKIEFVGYLVTPAFLFFKLILIAFSIQAGLYIANIELSFKKTFQIVLYAEVIPFLSAVVQFVYFLFVGVESAEQVNSFAPLSLFSLFNAENIPSFINYPLRMVNIYEIVYWVLLTVGLKIYLQKTFSRTLRLVASSYGIAFLLWMLFVVYIQIETA